ncbi:MAG: hypothetical protein QM820_19530 [Minicystis sp.]
MSTQSLPKWRVALRVHRMSDDERAYLLAGIQEVAKQSPLLQIPAIAASLAALAAKGGALAVDVSDVAAAEKQLRAIASRRDRSRDAFDRELLALKVLVETAAASEADLTGMGFTLLVTSKAGKAPPAPPAGLVIKPSRLRGKARVAVQGSGRGRYVAEASPYAAAEGTWSSLPGTGKERVLTGYPIGTKLWVRFATVRYGMQSDWCTPVLVTIP